MRKCGFCLSLGLLLSSAPVCPSSATDDLISEVRSRHGASLAAIGSLVARAEVISNLKVRPRVVGSANRSVTAPPATQKGRYWKAGNRVRIDETSSVFSPRDGDRTVVLDFARGEASILPRAVKGQPLPGGYAIDEAKFAIVIFDVWRDAVCLPNPIADFDRSHVTLDRALADPRCKVKTARWDQLDGRQVVYVEFDLGTGGNRTEVWVDPGVNYLTRKVVNHRPGPGRLRVEVTVESFAEPKPGVFFPDRVERRIFDGSAKTGHTTLVVSDIRINEPIPDSVFEVRFPPGAFVTDRIRGKTFTVGPTGRPDKPLGVVIQPDPASVAAAAGGRPTAPTPLDADERWWSPWKVSAAVFGALGVVSLVLLVRRRFRGEVGRPA